uniref:Uncharacterized protein n=1 Tax=Anguilla anguilla TaxID=7936 RepID=A0A0E9VSH5_ANGAN
MSSYGPNASTLHRYLWESPLAICAPFFMWIFKTNISNERNIHTCVWVERGGSRVL